MRLITNCTRGGLGTTSCDVDACGDGVGLAAIGCEVVVWDTAGVGLQQENMPPASAAADAQSSVVAQSRRRVDRCMMKPFKSGYPDFMLAKSVQRLNHAGTKCAPSSLLVHRRA